MQNIKEDIQNQIRKVLFAYPIKSEIVEEVCQVVEQNFQNYPSGNLADLHSDTKDQNRYVDKDADIDMLNQMYNQTL
jgi:hypothetical protein